MQVVEEISEIGHRPVTIRALAKAKDGTPRYEVIVAAGRDPVTGKYRQISRTSEARTARLRASNER